MLSHHPTLRDGSWKEHRAVFCKERVDPWSFPLRVPFISTNLSKGQLHTPLLCLCKDFSF